MLEEALLGITGVDQGQPGTGTRVPLVFITLLHSRPAAELGFSDL